MEAESNKKGLTRKERQSLKKQMIVRVYLFLREEYNFIKLHNYDNCKLSPLVSVVTRTANATGFSASYLSRIIAPYKKSAPSSSQSLLPSGKENDKKESDHSTLTAVNVKNELISDSSEEEDVIKKNMLDNVLDIKKEMSDVEEVILVIKQEISSIEQETIDVKQDTESEQEEINAESNDEPIELSSESSEEEDAIKKNMLDNVLAIKKEISDVEEILPDFQQETLVIKQEISSSEQDTDSEQEEINEEPNKEIDFEDNITKKTILKIPNDIINTDTLYTLSTSS